MDNMIKYKRHSRLKHMVYIDGYQMVFNSKTKEDLMQGVDKVELYYNEKEKVIGVKIANLGEERIEVKRYSPDNRPRIYCQPFLRDVVKVKTPGNFPVKKEGEFLYVFMG